jgi:hypothetical protein
MFAKYTRAAALLCAFGALSLAGCLAGEDDGAGGGGGGFSVETEMKVLEIVEPSATEAGTIETRSYDYGCEGDEVVKDSSDDVQSYVVTGGYLYLWDEEDECVALKLSGSSSSIIGKWSTTSFLLDAEIPEAYRPAGCDTVTMEEEEEEDLEGFDSLFQDIQISYDISQTRVKANFSGKICMGGLLAASFGTGGESPFEAVSSDCASATIKNTINDERLKISTSFSNEVLKVTFTSSGKSCSYSESMDISSKAPTCPEPDYEAEEEAFSDCVEDLDFFSNMEGDLAKRSAGSRVNDLVRKIRKASPAL